MNNFAMNDWIKNEHQWSVQVSNPLPLVLNRGQGVWLWDIEGRRYLDMASSCSSVNYGHCHPKILGALLHQVGRLSVCSRKFYHDQLIAFLEALCALVEMDKALPTNSGIEALENAVKAARRWGYQYKNIPLNQVEIIVTSQNFQNSSLGVMSFSGDSKYQENFGPCFPSVKVVPFGNTKALKSAITSYTCAVITEPIQSERGIILPPKGWLSEVDHLCKENNILFILNEIQTGLGRCGKLLAYHHENVHPDGVILGSALGGGFLPSGALVGKKEFLSVLDDTHYVSSWGRSPLVSAVGLVSLQVMQEENLIDRSAELGEYFLNRLRHIESPFIQDIRGQGLWIGIEVDPNWRTARLLCEQLMYMGILAREETETVVSLSPPLVITHEEIDWALIRIYQALQGSCTLPIQVPIAF
jgi:ornithine--oxo-acid transaminase